MGMKQTMQFPYASLTPICSRERIEIYRGMHAFIGAPVLVRLAPGPQSAAEHDEHFRAQMRIVTEAKVSSMLRHPNLCNVQNAGVGEHATWLAREYVDGNTLADRLNLRGPVSVSHVLDLGITLAELLDQSHKLEIVHGEVCPENIFLVDDDGTMRGGFRLFGFGGATFDGLGDVREDVRGVGATMYEMITGAPPGHSVAALSQFAVPLKLAAEIHRALLPLPEHRHESMAELLSELRRQRDLLEKADLRRGTLPGANDPTVPSGLAALNKAFDEMALARDSVVVLRSIPAPKRFLDDWDEAVGESPRAIPRIESEFPTLPGIAPRTMTPAGRTAAAAPKRIVTAAPASVPVVPQILAADCATPVVPVPSVPCAIRAIRAIAASAAAPTQTPCAPSARPRPAIKLPPGVHPVTSPELLPPLSHERTAYNLACRQPPSPQRVPAPLALVNRPITLQPVGAMWSRAPSNVLRRVPAVLSVGVACSVVIGLSLWSAARVASPHVTATPSAQVEEAVATPSAVSAIAAIPSAVPVVSIPQAPIEAAPLPLPSTEPAAPQPISVAPPKRQAPRLHQATKPTRAMAWSCPSGLSAPGCLPLLPVGGLLRRDPQSVGPLPSSGSSTMSGVGSAAQAIPVERFSARNHGR